MDTHKKTTTGSSQLQDVGEFVAKPFKFKDNSGLPKKKKKRKVKIPGVFDGGRDRHKHAEGEWYQDDEGEDEGRRRKRQSPGTDNYDEEEGKYDHRIKDNKAGVEGGNDEKFSEWDQTESDEAFAEMVSEALDSEEGAMIWERVFGEPISRFGGLPPPSTAAAEEEEEEEKNKMARREFVERVKRGLYETNSRGGERDDDDDDNDEFPLREEEDEEEELEQSERAKERRRGREGAGGRELRDRRKMREDAEIMARIQKLVDEEEERKRELERWRRYLDAWRAWDGSVAGIPWPVRSGRREDVASTTPGGGLSSSSTSAGGAGGGGNEGNEVRRWFLEDWEAGRIEKEEYVARLKGERVRWHPDRFCRRFGGQEKVERELVRDVTVVFQVLGGLWEEPRKERLGGAGGRRRRRERGW